MSLVKKYLSTIICAIILILSMFTFTACNLVQTDSSAYYSQVVATYYYNDKKLEVTMADLNDAFKTYGYSRFNQGYYTTMEACINDSLNYQIQKTLLFDSIATKLAEVYANEDTKDEIYNFSFIDLDNYDWDKTIDNIYSSNNANALEIRYNAFLSIQDTIDELVEQDLEDDDLLAEITHEDKESLRATKSEYESKIVIDPDTNKITRKLDDIELFDKTDVPTHFTLANNYDSKLTEKAYKKLIKSLQQTAKSESRSTDQDDVILKQERDSILSACQNKMLEVYQYWYESNLDITTDKVVDYYINQYVAQQTKFEYNIDAYREAMNKYTSDYVFFHDNSGEEYIVVSHILINFNEEQKALIKALDARLKTDKENFANDEDLLAQLDKQYDQDLLNIIMTTKSTYEWEGEEHNDYISEIMNDIKSYVSNNNLNNTDILSEKEIVKIKSKNFEDMIYKYNDDPGMMNTDFYYAVNINEGVSSSYVDEFVAGARELYNDYNAGDVLLRPVVSTYGIHIMFYSQMATNIVEPNSISTLDYETLLKYTVNTASDKTIFEYIYDKIETDDYYNNYVNNVINQAYNNANISIDSYKFKNLYK